MKTATAAGSSAAALDFKKSLLAAFAVSERANQLLLENVDDQAWRVTPPSGKGRGIADIAVPIHHVRLMWLAAAAIAALLAKSLEDPGGRVSGFKPVVNFVAYLIAHDAHHRGQIAMLARQAVHGIPAKAGFALWEWGTLWRERGSHK